MESHGLDETYILLGAYHPYGAEFLRVFGEIHHLRAVTISRHLATKVYAEIDEEIYQRYVCEEFFLDRVGLYHIIRKITSRYIVRAIIPLSEYDVPIALEILSLISSQISWNSQEVLKRFTSKSALKSYLKSRDPSLTLNHQRFVSSYEEVQKYREEFSATFVLKPDNGTFSIDVVTIHGEDWKKVQEYFARTKRSAVIMEDYIEAAEPGLEYVVNGQIDHQGVCLVYSVSKYQKIKREQGDFLYHAEVFVSRETSEFLELSQYAAQVMRTSGLRRCPFHMELIIEARSGKPTLVEVGARLPGGSSVFAINDVHSPQGYWNPSRDYRRGFNVFALAAHYYLHVAPFKGPLPEWGFYQENHFLAVTGLSHKKERVFSIQGDQEIESHKAFRRWSIRLKRGQKVDITTSLSTAPYEFHLVSKEPLGELLKLGENAREVIRWNETITLADRLFVFKELLGVRLRLLKLMWKVAVPQLFESKKTMEIRVLRRRRWYSWRELFLIKKWEKNAFALKLSWWALIQMLVKKGPITYVAYVDGKIAGYGICDLSADKDCLWVQSFVVLNEFRGKSVGQQIILTAEKEPGIREIRGLVRVDNQVARSLYRKMGYEETAVQPQYYPDGADGVVTHKRIAG